MTNKNKFKGRPKPTIEKDGSKEEKEQGEKTATTETEQTKE